MKTPTLADLFADRDAHKLAAPFNASAPDNGTAGSIAGAAAVSGPRFIGRQAQVLALLKDAGRLGSTREMIGAELKMKDGSVCSTVDALRAAGMVYEQGVRKSKSGIEVGVLYHRDVPKEPVAPVAMPDVPVVAKGGE